ncbi:actin-related protein 2/3 complex subunit 1A [Rhopalosiphum padi]|uniref:actin-related protein 2/3 complex subunit 1A n=1 Tax=Rhopalosiphum padi TaxID=40932 RepID=UPI00186385B4|nr:actin-related protein 2/3 complex subunit 1A [Rhopalosiphum padi]
MEYNLGDNPVTSHSWNANRTQIAVIPNSNEVQIYKYEPNLSDWTLLDNLDQHGLLVTGIDWAPNTNRIVTCSADRNAYVWTIDDKGKWKPTLVLLRISRAATCVKWSPNEKKFAVGSGAQLISVCYFEVENDWWVSKHIKKPIRSTVTALDWHPNNMVLATGTADFRVRLFNVHMKEVDQCQKVKTEWDTDDTSVPNLVAEFTNSSRGGGWIHGLAFNKTGNRLCWVAHDSSITVADVSKGSIIVNKLKTNELPFISCIWVSDRALVAAGHGCCPMLYCIDSNNKVQFVSKIDSSQKKEAAGLSAMKKFQSLDRQARINSDYELDTKHQNTLTCLRVHSESNDAVTKFTSSGLDGKIILWELNSLDKLLQGLKI